MMNKQLLKTLLIFIILIVSTTTCKKPEPETIGQIQGTVKNTSNQAIEGATIKINTAPSETAVFSKADGTYTFVNLTPQSYQITATKEGYVSNTQNITVIAGETKTLDFALISSTPTFTISIPTSGTNWNVNTQQTINWTSTNVTGSVKIELLKSGSVVRQIDNNTENDGTYIWTIPNDLSPSTEYKIKITSLSTSTVFDESDNFTLSVVAPTLSVTPTSRIVSNTAGTATFSITSNTNWTATSNSPSWFTITPSGNGDGTLTATYSENTSTSQRVATITISATGVSDKTIIVTQNQFTPSLIVTPSNRDVAQTAGNTTFVVSSNIAWNVSDNADWLTLSTSNGNGISTITANFSENLTGSQRIAQITFTGTNVSNQIVTVTQTGISYYIDINPNTTQNVGIWTGSLTINVSSNTSWSVSSNNTNFCSVSPTNGSNSGTVTVNYTTNPANSQRTATITISGSGITKTLDIIQTANSLVSGLVAYYPFNGNANDESGNGNNGTPSGATLTTDRKANANSAYSFDGVNDYINCGNSNSLNLLNNFSICVWIKTSTSQSNKGIIGRWNSNGSGGTEQYVIQSDVSAINFHLFTNSTNYTSDNSSYTNNTWIFYTIIWDGSKIYIYKNSNLVSQKSVTGQIRSFTQPFEIGRYSAVNTTCFNGLIDDIRVFNRALSVSEIQQLSNE